MAKVKRIDPDWEKALVVLAGVGALCFALWLKAIEGQTFIMVLTVFVAGFAGIKVWQYKLKNGAK